MQRRWRRGLQGVMRARELTLCLWILGCSGPDDPPAADARASSGGDAAGGGGGGGPDGGEPTQPAAPDAATATGGGDCDLLADTGCGDGQTCKVDIGWVLETGVIAATSDPACVSTRGGLSDYRCMASDECIAGWSCVVLVGYGEGQCREHCRTAADCTPADGVDWGCHPVDGLGDLGFCDELVSL